MSFKCTSHSPNHAYMHEIIHLEPPLLGKRHQKKKSLLKATKRLEINTPSKGIWKGKNHQQKQKFTKATKTLQINTFLKGIWKGKSTYSITFNHRCINSMMVRRHQFPVYLTLTKSCIYGRNHTLRTPPPTWKKTPRKTQDRLESSLSIFIFGILNLTCYFPYDPRWVGQTFFCWRTIAPSFGLHSSSRQKSDMPKKTALLAGHNCGG